MKYVKNDFVCAGWNLRVADPGLVLCQFLSHVDLHDRMHSGSMDLRYVEKLHQYLV